MNPTESSPPASLPPAPVIPAGPRSRSKVKAILFLLFVTLLGVGGAAYFGSSANASAETQPPEAAPAPPPAPKVTVATVQETPYTEHRELLGRVEAMETVEIRPRVSGHIQEVRLHAGQVVQKGDILFIIDPRWHQAQYDLAKAGLESARVRVRIAERESRRSQELLTSKAISVEEAEARASSLEEAKAGLLAAQATLDTAKLDLDHTEIRAPIGGRVSRAYITPGNLVSGAPGGATLLATLVSEGEVYVYADVDEASFLVIDQLRRNAQPSGGGSRNRVEMQLTDEEGFPHHGVIESADNRLDPGTGSLVLRMVFPNPDGRLVPGLSARVRVPVGAPQPAVMISDRAIGTNQSQKFVLTVNQENVVAHRTVKPGALVGGKRVIREGLQPGDRVIVNGSQRVSAGMTVTPETAAVAMK